MLWLLLACTDPATQETGSTDSGTEDTGTGDTGTGDTGETGDTGAFEPLDGHGTLSGDCNSLDEGEWDSASPFIFRNSLDLLEGFEDEDLLEDSQTILAEGNLNSSSLYSEIFAFEVMARCEAASLLKTEGQVDYANPDGKKTDLLILVDERQIGLSVARGFTYPMGTAMSPEKADELLEKKVGDLPLSQDNGTGADAWERSILHIIAVDAQHGDEIEAAWGRLEAGTKMDFGLMITVTDGQDADLY